MSTHRHPLADSFRGTIESLRLLTAKLDDPQARGAILPRLREGIVSILRGEPRPSPDLCRELYAVQSELQRLFRSQRNEYAIVAKINDALESAKKLVGDPPLGVR